MVICSVADPSHFGSGFWMWFRILGFTFRNSGSGFSDPPFWNSGSGLLDPPLEIVDPDPSTYFSVLIFFSLRNSCRKNEYTFLPPKLRKGISLIAKAFNSTLFTLHSFGLFWCWLDPNQCVLKGILERKSKRIRKRPNVVDLAGSGSATLLCAIVCTRLFVFAWLIIRTLNS